MMLQKPVMYNIQQHFEGSISKIWPFVDAKVVVYKFTSNSYGFGFVTFHYEKAMKDAIHAIDGMSLDDLMVETKYEKGRGSRENKEDFVRLGRRTETKTFGIT
ncbi:Glycine-rich RNA-binding protein [Nymphaea thermarum]|nr:Glycine-rich RNA-binding protein [Nymphaea thermarum]